MSRLSASQVGELFSLASVDSVEHFLHQIGTTRTSLWKWVSLGGRENNAGSVNLTIDPGQPLIERVTNGMDAHIELQYELASRPANLDSPRAAVTALWGLDSTRLTRETRRMVGFIDDMAPKTLIRVVGSLTRGDSSVVIQDTGIGQHPHDFSRTILSLGESNKVSKPHLMGAFGQGGSSTFAYCPYSVIISRRHRYCLDGRTDLIGWTIVRKYDDDSLKTFRYEYLVDPNGGIPELEPQSLLKADIDFESGMRIAHIAYDLGRLNTRWSLVGYRYFDNLLFDPVLPYRIEDHRVSPQFNRNLYGARNRLEGSELAGRPEAQTYEADLSRLGGEGRVRIRYWVFKPASDSVSDPSDERGVKLDSYLDYDKSSRTIIFTLNGQRHHTQEKRLVREARLGALADYLLVHVDCDGLSRRLKKEIFPATRAGAALGERREDLLLQAVRDALSDPWLLQKLEEVIRRRQAQISDESTRRVERMLNRLITFYRTERHPGGQQGPSEVGSSRTGTERQIHDPPTFLRFADHRRLELISGQITTIYLVTDGPDNLLSRPRGVGRPEVSLEGSNVAAFSLARMYNGRLSVHVQVPSSASLGQRARLVASLEIPPATFLSDSREVRIVAPPPPYAGVDPPTRFEFARTGPLIVEIGGKSMAEIHTDAQNDILTRAVNPAIIQGSVDIPDVHVAIRGPRDGSVYAEVHASRDAVASSAGVVTATLKLPNGTELTTTRTCQLVPPRPDGPRAGIQEAPTPAYQIRRVWQAAPPDSPSDPTWSSFDPSWTAEKIGRWELNGDELWLYVNMDEREFQNERLRWARRFGDNHAVRLRERYLAYLAFHLFQLHEQEQEVSAASQQGGPDSYDPDSEAVARELKRVSSTLIQTLRSEAELMRLESTGDEVDP